MLTRYGLDVAIPILIAAFLIFVLGFFISNIILKSCFIVFGAFVFLFTAYFFRDPDRRTPEVPNGIISPADGKIVTVMEVEEKEFFHARVKQVSIFMSPLNVHVNRYPISGRIEFFRYIKGRYMVAFEEKSSEANERALIGIDNGSWKVLFKQIAGFVARRIVCPVHVGMDATVGERFGMIKFGSRVDVLMPLNADIQVKLNDHVVAGETVLAVVK